MTLFCCFFFLNVNPYQQPEFIMQSGRINKNKESSDISIFAPAFGFFFGLIGALRYCNWVKEPTLCHH